VSPSTIPSPGTSSSTTAGGACTGSGVPPTKIDGVIGISKAYCTRVGDGPFPTELQGPIADVLRTRGHEFGSVTGRPRRCGWVDATGLRYAARINGLDTIALTKLDVLDTCETLRICVGYRYGGEVLTDFPEEERIWHEAEPVYEELSGWQSSTHRMRDYAELPSKAREYVERLAELVGVGFSLISTGPVRDETILVSDSVLTRWFPALRSALRMASVGDAELAAMWYAAQVLVLTGHGPIVDRCVICGRGVSRGAVFSLALGGALCQADRGRDAQASPASAVALAAMGFLRETQAAALSKLALERRHRDEVAGLLQRYLEYRLETRLKSPSIIQKMV